MNYLIDMIEQCEDAVLTFDGTFFRLTHLGECRPQKQTDHILADAKSAFAIERISEATTSFRVDQNSRHRPKLIDLCIACYERLNKQHNSSGDVAT